MLKGSVKEGRVSLWVNSSDIRMHYMCVRVKLLYNNKIVSDNNIQFYTVTTSDDIQSGTADVQI